MRHGLLLSLTLGLLVVPPLAAQPAARIASALGAHSLSAALDSTASASAAIIRRGVIKKSPITAYSVSLPVGDDPEGTIAQVLLTELSPAREAPNPGAEEVKLSFASVDERTADRSFEFDGLEFKADPTGFDYTAQAQLFNAEGEPVDDPVSITLSAEPERPARLLVRTRVLDSDDSNCAHGGVAIEQGLDDGANDGRPDDGVLQDGEVDRELTVYVCNGTPGFSTLTRVTALAGLEHECGQAGGVRVLVGLDDGKGEGVANDGLLHDDEVQSYTDVCNGTDGVKGDDGAKSDDGKDSEAGGCASAPVAMLALLGLVARRRSMRTS